MKIKVYAVTLLAMSPMEDSTEENYKTYVLHKPGILSAYSAEEAAEKAYQQALKEWSDAEGWYGHQALAVEVTKEFFELGMQAFQAGAVDTEADGTEHAYRGPAM